jgi:EAL domain-containing protein (putative c-di-GMP-specific phosphodiesterase class I)
VKLDVVDGCGTTGKLRPDFIKLDRALIAGIDSDPAKRALVAAMSTFAFEMRADIVAEGVESPAELDAAGALGLRYAQGFLTGRPGPAQPNWGSATARDFRRTHTPLTTKGPPGRVYYRRRVD